MRLIARPIEQWPGQLTDPGRRQEARFTATWGDTVDLLEREVRHLVTGRDTEVVLQLAVTESQLRLDGWIRADATPTHPGVVLSFDSRHGPLRYSTDLFSRATYWQGGGRGHVTIPGLQCNVRAIALGLEALRKVDRYGISKGGEQYRGWHALGAGTPMPAPQMTIEEAARLLAEAATAGLEQPLERSQVLVERLLKGEGVALCYRVASKRAHPDAGGDPETFRRLTEARDLLARHQG